MKEEYLGLLLSMVSDELGAGTEDSDTSTYLVEGPGSGSWWTDAGGGGGGAGRGGRTWSG